MAPWTTASQSVAPPDQPYNYRSSVWSAQNRKEDGEEEQVELLIPTIQTFPVAHVEGMQMEQQLMEVAAQDDDIKGD